MFGLTNVPKPQKNTLFRCFSQPLRTIPSCFCVVVLSFYSRHYSYICSELSCLKGPFIYIHGVYTKSALRLKIENTDGQPLSVLTFKNRVEANEKRIRIGKGSVLRIMHKLCMCLQNNRRVKTIKTKDFEIRCSGRQISLRDPQKSTSTSMQSFYYFFGFRRRLSSFMRQLNEFVSVSSLSPFWVYFCFADCQHLCKYGQG